MTAASSPVRTMASTMPFGDQVLCHLDAFRERLPAQGVVDAGTQEADERAWLGDGHVAEGPPGRENPADRRIPQVDEVGKPGCLVCHDGPADFYHLNERRGALLHAGASGGGRGDERQPLRGRAPDGGDDARCGRCPDRAAEEAELADHQGRCVPPDVCRAGKDGFVGAGPQLSALQFSAVAGQAVGRVDSPVP